LNEKQGTLCVTHADRVLSSHRAPRAFDSKLEERFQRDFIGLGSRWDISREENLIPLESTVFIPDFSFRMRGQPELRVDLEIVGYWTRDYLARKQLIISRLPPSRIIFCVDEKLRCGGDSLQLPFPFLSFHGRVPAPKVLEILEDFARREDLSGIASAQSASAPAPASDLEGGSGPQEGRALGAQ
jgi:predicted nuclease of restriction endonuclease-like RecB superfamily